MLIGKSYVPLLKAKIAEVEAYRQLSEEAKERTFPIFQLRPWPNANRLELAVRRLKEATNGHPFALGLDVERRNSTSTKQAQSEFDELFNTRLGFQAYYEFLSDIEEAVPVLMPTREADNLLQQLGRAENLDRGLVVHQQRGSLIPITDTIVGLPPLPHDTIFVIDAAWSGDPLLLQSWAIPITERIVSALPNAEVVVMASSFPDSFGHIIGNHEEVAHETHLFDAIIQRIQNADITYGDWASTRLSQQGGGGTIPSRIDLPRPASWQIFRADPSSDRGFVVLAEDVVSHEAFQLAPECWGRLQIESTTGPGVGITGVKMNTSARINMHMTIKSGATTTLDADEQPYED